MYTDPWREIADRLAEALEVVIDHRHDVHGLSDEDIEFATRALEARLDLLYGEG
jgi:hypothetical protein